MKYGLLRQTNPEYQRDRWCTLEDLYEGGFRILDHVERYIKRHVDESDERYRERLEHAEYIPYLGMVVDSYAANLFAQPLTVAADESLDDFWSAFATNADLKGDPLSRVLREVFTTTILKRRGYVACDFPATDIFPDTRAAEDASGATRGYAFELQPEELVDWAYDDVVTRIVQLKNEAQVEWTYGLFSWTILRREVCRRPTPEDSRDTFFEEFRVWRLNAAGNAEWQLFRTPPRKRGDAPPRDDDDLPVAAEGTTTFRQIPIVEVCVPPGLWLGNKLGPLALGLFRRRSALMASENRSLFPIPVFKHGPEIGGVGAALPPDAQQNPARGHDPIGTAQRLGALGIGYQDDFGYVEPKGTAHELVDKQLGDSVDEFFRVAHMMASSISSTSTALGRSGSSKEQDYRAMSIVLEAYGAIVREVAARVYGVIAEGRGEAVTWRVHGLDKFDVIDRAIVLEEAKTLSSVSIPSTTFRVAWQTKVALALLGNATPEQQAAIEEEIEAGVSAEEQLQTLLLARPDDQTEPPPTDSREEDGRSGRPGPRAPRAQDRTGPPPE